MTTIDSVEATIARDRYGRPLIVPVGGGKPVAMTRCTTYVKVLEDTFNLSKWQQRMVAIGLAERPDLLLSVAAHRDDKKQLDQLCEDAAEAAKAHAAATTGTALHALTEQVDRGLDPGPVPADYIADIAAYVRATEPLKPVLIEQMVVLDDMRIAGTPDRVVEYEGRQYIADLKTGNVTYGIGSIAMQLAVYAHGTVYNADGTRGPDLRDTVDQKNAIIIHLPAGSSTCRLLWVNIAAGWEAVQLATQVRAWRARKGLTVPV